MARHEHNREDLLRDATALVERIELKVDAFDEPVFVGFRDNGCGSVYFGQDHVLHFDQKNRLRRAYVAPILIRAEQGRLVSLRRDRSVERVRLAPQEYTEEETREFQQRSWRALAALREALANGQYEIVGQAPESAPVVERAATWLGRLLEGDSLRIAHSPRIR